MSSAEISLSATLVSQGSGIPTILKLVAELTGMRLALLARVADKSWIAHAIYDRMDYGINVGDQLDMGAAVSSEHYDLTPSPTADGTGAQQLPRKHATSMPTSGGICTSLPVLLPNDAFFGMLCAIDLNPVVLKPELDDALISLAELIAIQLAADDERKQLENKLRTERETSHAREEFIAVLAHDLRNPLSGIIGAANFLKVLEPGPDQNEMFRVIGNSSDQIANLINDVLDFARGRLGAGIPLDSRGFADLTVLANDAISELCAAHPGRTIDLHHAGPVVANVDEVRIRQLLSNLLGNALQHSPADKPVNIKVDYIGKTVRIAITNGGPPLSATKAATLFTPFVSRPNRSPRSGLGLGLFIASEIARAHGGEIKVSSSKKGTTLTTILPRGITP